MLASRRSILCRRFIPSDPPTCPLRNGLSGSAIQEYVFTDELTYFSHTGTTTYSEAALGVQTLQIPIQCKTITIWVGIDGGAAAAETSQACFDFGCALTGVYDCPCLEGGDGLVKFPVCQIF